MPLLVLWKKILGYIDTFCKLWMQMWNKTVLHKHFAKCKKLFFCWYISFFPQRVLTINEPFVYMARDVMNLMKCNEIQFWGPLEGVSPENQDFLGPWKWQRAKWVPCGPKKINYLNIWVGWLMLGTMPVTGALWIQMQIFIV